MKKRVTRHQIRSWLAPMRRCFAEMKSGEVDSIRGYAVTRDHEGDYARIDFCIAGFRALIARLCSEIDTSPLERIEKKLAAGIALTVAEVDGALTLFKHCEDELIKRTADEIKSAVLTEQIVIELDEIREKKAA